METSKRVVLDPAGTIIGTEGAINIRFRKETVEDGKVIGFTYHRTMFEPGNPVNRQMADVNRDLQEAGYPAPDGLSMKAVAAMIEREHTSDVVAKYREARNLK